MEVNKFLAELAANGVHLWADGDLVRYRAPKGALTDEYRNLLTVHKAEILSALREPRFFPLSFGQQRMWLLHQLEPDQPFYNEQAVCRLKGTLNEEALDWSLNEIARRHEPMRTTFAMKDDEPVQIVSNTLPEAFSVVDLRSLNGPEQAASIDHLIQDNYRRPFDLSHGPVFRGKLLKLSEKEHVFLHAMHHIATDGWSMNVFFRELSILYEAFLSGRPSPLPEVQFRYTDFAVQQRQSLDNEGLQSQFRYWKRQLTGASVLQLPIDHNRPPVSQFKAGVHPIRFSPELTTGLHGFSNRHGVTLFMTLLATFKTLLYKYSGQQDIVIGSPVSNRERPEVEDLIGIFINTLVLRTDLSGDPSFRELLDRIRKVTLEAYANQDYPVEKLLEELDLERDMSHNPLFQALFVMRNAPTHTIELTDLTLQPNYVPSGNHDLSIWVWDQDGGLDGNLVYDSTLFEPATISRMIRHFEVLLRGIIADPDKKLSALPLLTPEEKQQLLVTWNDTAAPYPETCIHHLFEERSAQMPDAIALIFEGTHVRYSDLNSRANQLAHYLQSLGMTAETPVGVCMERSPEMVAALLAILKAGGAILPLDPHYPKERLSYLLSDSKAGIVITRRKSSAALPASAARIVDLDSDRQEIARESRANPRIAMSADAVAYLCYTSGSTGKPKGVLGLHRGAVNRFAWMWKAFPFKDGEMCCQKTSLNFVDSIWEIFGPLLKGIPSYIVPDSVVKDPARLVDSLADHGVTRIVLVPSLLEAILESVADLKNKLPRLKICVTSGETLSTRLCRQFRDALPECVLLNLFGSSEASADATAYNATAMPEGLQRVPIGRPIDNTRIYVLDSSLQPVPVGIPGEIYVGGAGLARGYWNRPELNVEKFVPDPFSENPGQKLYKTGDVAKYLSDGNLDFLGRADHQVKIRGVRVEPGEIEETLLQHPAIRHSVVLVDGEELHEKRIIAYVIPKEGFSTGAEDLRAYCKQTLPDALIPAAWIILQDVPLSPNGKVDRAGLPKSDLAAGASSEPRFVAPRDALEIQIAGIWERLLLTRPIGIRDDFFELGGNSLLAVRLFAKIKKITGKDLPLATLFQARTIEALANALKQEGWKPPWSSLVVIQPGGSKPPFFLVHGAGGNVLVCSNLVRYLSPDQPVYGLQSQGLDGIQTPSTRIAGIAAHYLAEIRTVQAEGPYFLGGYSFGGVVAYEMGRQLRAQGHDVALLALFDSYTPSYYRLLSPKKRLRVKSDSLVRRLRFHFRRLVFGPERLLHFRKKIVNLKIKANNFMSSALYQMMLASGRPLPKRFQKLRSLNRQALMQYVPKTYPGKITLFYASTWHNLGPDHRMGWAMLASDVEVHEVSGDHVNLMQEPQVKILAEKLNQILKNAQNSVADAVNQESKKQIESAGKIQILAC